MNDVGESPPTAGSFHASWWKPALVIGLLALAVRLFMAGRSDADDLVGHFPDASTYLVPTYQLLKTGRFQNGDGDPEVHRTPGYPVLLAGLLFSTGHQLQYVLLIQAALLSLGPVMLYQLGRRIMPGLPAFIAGLLAAVSPWSASYAAFPLTDGPFQALLIGQLLLLYRACRTPSAATAVAAVTVVGAIAAALVLIRPVWFLVPITGMTWIWQQTLWKRRTWLGLVLFLTASCLPLLGWQQRNAAQTGLAKLSDIGNLTAWHYLAVRVRAAASGQDRFELKQQTMAESRSLQLSEAQQDAENAKKSSQVFAAHPVLTIHCFLLSAGEHLIHPSPEVLRILGLGFPLDYWFLFVAWILLLGLALVGWLQIRTTSNVDRSYLNAIILVCGLLTLASGLSFGQGCRLRLPIEIPVMLLAGMGISSIYQRRWPPRGSR